jgi:hypothetical protein
MICENDAANSTEGALASSLMHTAIERYEGFYKQTNRHHDSFDDLFFGTEEARARMDEEDQQLDTINVNDSIWYIA